MPISSAEHNDFTVCDVQTTQNEFMGAKSTGNDKESFKKKPRDQYI